MKYIPDFIPIPKVFYSFETGEPFKICSVCDVNLMAAGTNYLIEKSYNAKEVICEYAICFPCREKFENELSVNSRKRIDHYFDEHVNLEKRRRRLLQQSGKQYEDWIAKCVIKNKDIDKNKEYNIYGHFIDTSLVFSEFPYAISKEVLDDIVDLLSPETLGALADFSNKVSGITLPQGFVLI